MLNLMKQKTAVWMGGTLALAVIAAIVVANLQETEAQLIDLTRLRSDVTHMAPSIPVPVSGTAFDNSYSSDARPSINSRVSPLATNTADAVYAALYSLDPEQRLTALDTIWQSAETFYKLDNIIRRIDELAADADPRIAELAPFVLAQMMELSGMQDTLMNPNQDAYVATAPALADDLFAHAELGRANFSADSIDDFARALHHQNAAIRMQAIEAAQIQRDEHSVAVLIQATRDADPDNRLAAVEGLRQMLEEGFGDAAQISDVVQQSSHDPDPKVAEAAQQAIRTQ